MGLQSQRSARAEMGQIEDKVPRQSAATFSRQEVMLQGGAESGCMPFPPTDTDTDKHTLNPAKKEPLLGNERG